VLLNHMKSSQDWSLGDRMSGLSSSLTFLIEGKVLLYHCGAK
jgi:hypothetical protein